MLAVEKGTIAMLELLKSAKKADIPAKYVLFDSWFSSPSSLHSVKEIGYDVIAMVKKTPKMFFRYNGEDMPLTTIYSKNKKRRGRSQISALRQGRRCKGWKNHSCKSGLCPQQEQKKRISLPHFHRHKSE